MLRKLLSSIKSILSGSQNTQKGSVKNILSDMHKLTRDIQAFLSSNSGRGGFASEILASARHLEVALSHLQGKGWGFATVAKEFLSATSLLEGNTVHLCVDIGGNKGIYSDEIIRQFPNVHLVIFEPALSNIEILQKKFSEKPNVVIEPFAISNKAGQATLFSNEDGSGLASLTQRRLDHFDIPFNHTESVQTLCFEDYWRDKLDKQHIEICKMDIEICKMDIEGHELNALSGFGEALQHIDVIQFEFGGLQY